MSNCKDTVNKALSYHSLNHGLSNMGMRKRVCPATFLLDKFERGFIVRKCNGYESVTTTLNIDYKLTFSFLSTKESTSGAIGENVFGRGVP